MSLGLTLEQLASLADASCLSIGHGPVKRYSPGRFLGPGTPHKRCVPTSALFGATPDGPWSCCVSFDPPPRLLGVGLHVGGHCASAPSLSKKRMTRICGQSVKPWGWIVTKPLGSLLSAAVTRAAKRLPVVA